LNWQNLPTEAKQVFIPEVGHVFVQGDFSNLELRVQSFEWNDSVLQKMFAEGKNIHDENTKVMFGITKDHPHWKYIRRAAKVAVFGRGYGGGIRGIYERVAAQVPELNFTMAQFRKADQAYYAAHPKLAEGMDKASKTAIETRCCATATGRKRFFLGTPDEISREGINTPIQSVAGDIANESLIDAYYECLKHDDWKLVATVHDSIVIECPIVDLDLCAKALKRIMEKPRHLWKRDIVFPADIEVSSRSWGQMIPYEAVRKINNKWRIAIEYKKETLLLGPYGSLPSAEDAYDQAMKDISEGVFHGNKKGAPKARTQAARKKAPKRNM
jgi:DNA polymerase I-like protein with 3'-5' exonuclease and polymerase domains